MRVLTTGDVHVLLFSLCFRMFYTCTSYFTLLAMSLGCRVLAFEPQLRLLPALKRSLYFNNFDTNKLLTLIPCALSDVQSVFSPNDHHNWGEWSLSESNSDARGIDQRNNSIGPSSPSEGGTKKFEGNNIQATTVDSLVQEDVLVFLL